MSDCVRLEIQQSAGSSVREFLRRSLRISESDIYECPGPIDLSAMMRLSQLQGHAELKDQPWPPQPSADFVSGSDIFEVISQQDRILLHPYQSFEPVVELVRQAAADPDVLAIKQTLYRTSRNSAIVTALAEAARAGKSVTAIVERKVRFDELRYIVWARQLETACVYVIYGIRGLKVHAKICIVVRREPTGIRRYVHIGSGNYNEATARLYSDTSLFTSEPQVGDDANKFFNAVAGFSVPMPMQKIVMAPIGLREGFWS